VAVYRGVVAACRRQEVAGSSSVTFVETDFEKRLTDLKGSRNSNLAMRGEKLDVADPDGNQIVFAYGKTESHRAVK
jgi:hypothetical protein